MSNLIPFQFGSTQVRVALSNLLGGDLWKL